ncbi:PilZ domain-containing protein [Novosphingobium kunmingense]|uniref:PilZ domain-containing protein n=1 Tax=Novosphingobium kunmingense TaxID=1211806 RepID=A0A2N0H5R5_9SPHN|nr:PilZ domain-containing protein [Novosphingobium kunmingense]PKB14264.1 PilZ domain-containing protein [Novosphingobium kunmingense]
MESGEDGQRQLSRDSLFVLAEMRIDGVPGEVRVRVRNLSAGGLMAEGVDKIQRGQQVWINVRNVGWVEGSIAWVQDDRCGVAFKDEIDPMVARAPVAAAHSTPSYIKAPMKHYPAGQLRKI